MNTNPSVFSFESHSNIRAVNIDGNPWFVSSDVCKAIGIKHTASAMRALDDDEKGVHSMHTLVVSKISPSSLSLASTLLSSAAAMR